MTLPSSSPDRSMKAFREFLNREYPDAQHRHNNYRQRTRGYGDYLYFQDREKFDVEYQSWLEDLSDVR